MPRPGGVLAYHVSGTGPPLTLLHGFTQSSGAWRELAELLGDSRQIIAPDIRGHGGSVFESGSPHTMDACSGDLVALWTALGIESGDLIGYSMGGRLALHAAVTEPARVRSLVLVSAHAGLPVAAA
ncbi:MAG: alpha/beta fold hydrolase, partial [Candidatus Dormiibacterota bacterium]